MPGALASTPWLPEWRDEEEGYLNRTSHAVMQGTPLPVVAKLLGHSQTTMTLRYAHTGDRETEAAAERIGRMISELLGMSPIAETTSVPSRDSDRLNAPRITSGGPIDPRTYP